MKKYVLSMTFQHTNFDTDYEKSNGLDFESDDLKELVDILNKYVNRFLVKEKKSNVWEYFNGVITNQSLKSYDLERTVYNIFIDRKD